ncbi:hypothetical protein [Williamsia sp. DF01-3]|uniref:hypothetical protein n=1 Tax=Williamsia sp. DF01-3 TaxID=2934157 RepID=UPI001FF5111B|nr:hypothetical protein [Williamsia sp. DF01-3]MCK0516671.1 hypothetical protein [Williamsia sp. DF01-3]
MKDPKSAVMPHSVERRFGVEIVQADHDTGDTVLTMNLDDLLDPVTGTRSLGPAALLLDGSGGLNNHLIRPPDMWSLTSELSMDLDRTAMTGDGEVVASARSISRDPR